MKFLERFWFGCGHCHGGDSCPLADGLDFETFEKREYGHGASLVLAVILVFLLPAAMTIGGAFLVGTLATGPSDAWQGLWQFAGAISGFALGVAVARFVFWVRARHAPADGGVE